MTVRGYSCVRLWRAGEDVRACVCVRACVRACVYVWRVYVMLVYGSFRSGTREGRFAYWFWNSRPDSLTMPHIMMILYVYLGPIWHSFAYPTLDRLRVFAKKIPGETCFTYVTITLSKCVVSDEAIRRHDSFGFINRFTCIIIHVYYVRILW